MTKLGRPTDDPKNVQLKVRITSTDKEKLEKCSETLKISKSDVVRKAIDEVYQDISKKK